VDDFEKMDSEAGLQVMEPVGLPSKLSSQLPANQDVLKLRESLVKDYHAGSPSLIESLGDEADSEEVIKALIKEVIRETDSLLGNGLVALNNGELRDASVISYKRTEAIEKAIRALTAKRALEKESGIDIESPSMMVVFRFFMEKVNDTFVQMNTDDEMRDVFFATIGEQMQSWKKELKSRFKELKGEE
jgi:hypothetical protein